MNSLATTYYEYVELEGGKLLNSSLSNPCAQGGTGTLAVTFGGYEMYYNESSSIQGSIDMVMH